MNGNEMVTVEKRQLIFGGGGNDNPSIYAAAVRAAEEVKVAYQMALWSPRNVQQARQVLLEVCSRPTFAELVEWEKPVGGRKIRGVTIRLMEEAVKAYRNIQVTKATVYEDALIRKIAIKVIDLESNLSYEDETTIQKTVERANPGDREVIAQRLNSRGEKTYTVAATEDEMLGKTNAQASKIIRTLAKRLIPSDLIEEGLLMARKTIRDADSIDPKSSSNKMFDAFMKIGVTPEMVEAYIGSNKAIFTPDELASLKGLYVALKDKETTWKEVMENMGGGRKEDVKKEKESSLLQKAKEFSAKASIVLTPCQKNIDTINKVFLEQVRSLMNDSIPMSLPIHELTDAQCIAIQKRANEIADEMIS